MRNVFTSAELAHVWANGRRDSGKNSGGSMYIERGAIYSYGSHFALAAFVSNDKGETLLLRNSDTYGNTTAKHACHVWRALSRSQNETALAVPKLNRALLDDLGQLARECAKEAAERLEKSAKARTNRPYLIEGARTLLGTANKLATFAARKGRRVETFADLADDSKPAVAAYLKTVRGAEYRAQASGKLASASEGMRDIRDRIEQYATRENRAWSTAVNIVAAVKQTRDRAEIAANLYKQAGARKPAEIARILRACDSISAEYVPLADAEIIEENTRRAAEWASETVAELARYRRGMRSRCPIPGRNRGVSFYAATRIRDIHPEIVRAPYAALLQRVENISGARYLADYIENTRTRLADYKSACADTARNWHLPSLPDATELARMARHIAKGTRAAAYYGPIIAPLVAEIEALRIEHAARVLAANAERVAQWRAGERVSVPHDVPTMARIRGEIVETSKGATVPLEHARRLVRIVRRVMAQGGESFADGAGPMVGHYRLNEVLFTGQTVIGCHVFEPDEAQRAMEMIEASEIVATV